MALIENARVVARILRPLDLPTDLPDRKAARSPPLRIEDAAWPRDTAGDATF